jgi:hypothetical protein
MSINMLFKQASPNSGVSGAESGLFIRPVSAGRRKRAGLCGALATGALLFFFSLSGISHAAVPAPAWSMSDTSIPTSFSTAPTPKCDEIIDDDGECQNRYQVTATNAGSEPTSDPIIIEDKLPAGLSVNGFALSVLGPNRYEFLGGCSEPSSEVVRCTYSGTLAPDERLRLFVDVGVNAGAAGPFVDRATVSGGGAASASTEVSASLDASSPFGFSGFDFYKAGLDGSSETQAGGHPYELQTTIEPNSEFELGTPYGVPSITGVDQPKDIVVNLPLGFAGSTLSAPECPLSQLSTEQGCPPETIVGHLITEPINSLSVNSPIWNLVPERGYPAEFGYKDGAEGAHIFYVHVVPTPEGYVLQTEATDIPSIILRRITATFYGDPALRDGTERPQVPFFTNPTACSNGPQVASVYMDSWEHPGTWRTSGHDPEITTGEVSPSSLPVLSGESSGWVSATSVSPQASACNALQFAPAIGSQPTTHQADSPSGLEFEQRLPQTENAGVPATPALKDTTIVFPPGMTVDPSSADGLGTCSNAQIGWEGPAAAGAPLFDFTDAKPECPESSKIGTLELETPLIPGKLYGEVFLAAQDSNPFGSVFATYIVVNDPITGVVLKLAGEVKLCASAGELIDGRACQAAGQITSTFDETPQLPFSDLKVHFFGGPRSEFATPPNCGTYTTDSVLEPWSAPDSGLAPTPFDNYDIDEDCAIGFNPAFTGGSTNLQAGAYTTFQASFERQDSDQELGGAEINLPPGLLATITSVTECGAAELAAEAADAPTGGCPANSQVGTVQAGAGPGPNPLFVPGKVFWTGPYNGGPFGLAVVVSANPGSFHFGNVLVRQSIHINPYTAAVTDVSDPFPTFIDPRGTNGDVNGIPIKLRRVDVEINRPGFVFNPTNCVKETFRVGGAITSVSGSSKTLSTPFQVTNCGHLRFEPKVAVSTQAKTSKADGASLTYRVTYPSVSQGTDADIKYVKVELPQQLPSRLTTLQKACTQAQFQANPSGCPGPSVIGHAKAIVPNLPVPLEGPVYFVSNGGEAFPNLVMVLQGDGVTVQLVGDTLIKNGVTSTTFHAIPDNPVQTFEVTLPEGPYSALAANGNLCKPTVTKLVKVKQRLLVKGKLRTVTRRLKQQVATTIELPNEYVGQNGALYKYTAPIKVEGCPKAKVAKKKKKKGEKRK